MTNFLSTLVSYLVGNSGFVFISVYNLNDVYFEELLQFNGVIRVQEYYKYLNNSITDGDKIVV